MISKSQFVIFSALLASQGLMATKESNAASSSSNDSAQAAILWNKLADRLADAKYASEENLYGTKMERHVSGSTPNKVTKHWEEQLHKSYGLDLEGLKLDEEANANKQIIADNSAKITSGISSEELKTALAKLTEAHGKFGEFEAKAKNYSKAGEDHVIRVLEKVKAAADEELKKATEALKKAEQKLHAMENERDGLKELLARAETALNGNSEVKAELQKLKAHVKEAEAAVKVAEEDAEMADSEKQIAEKYALDVSVAIESLKTAFKDFHAKQVAVKTADDAHHKVVLKTKPTEKAAIAAHEAELKTTQEALDKAKKDLEDAQEAELKILLNLQQSMPEFVKAKDRLAGAVGRLDQVKINLFRLRRALAEARNHVKVLHGSGLNTSAAAKEVVRLEKVIKATEAKLKEEETEHREALKALQAVHQKMLDPLGLLTPPAPAAPVSEPPADDDDKDTGAGKKPVGTVDPSNTPSNNTANANTEATTETPVVTAPAAPVTTASDDMAINEFKPVENKDKLADERTKTVVGENADAKFTAEVKQVFKDTLGFNDRAVPIQKTLAEIKKKQAEAEKKATEEAEKKNKKGTEKKKLRRLAGEEKTATKPVDHISNVIVQKAEEALRELTKLQANYGETYQLVKDKATYTVFKSDAEKTGAAISRAEAVIKLNDENKSKTAELKNAKATILGLGLGLGLGIPALTAVVFTVLVKTNRVLLNFGSTASADV